MRRQRCIGRARSARPRIATRVCYRAIPSTQRRFITWRRFAASRAGSREGVDLVRRALAVEPHVHPRMCCLAGRWSSWATPRRRWRASSAPSHATASTPTPTATGAMSWPGSAVWRRRSRATSGRSRSSPASLANWCNLGAAQAELGRHDDALASYERVTHPRAELCRSARHSGQSAEGAGAERGGAGKLRPCFGSNARRCVGPDRASGRTGGAQASGRGAGEPRPGAFRSIHRTPAH